jgi:hypothetical protein
MPTIPRETSAILVLVLIGLYAAVPQRASKVLGSFQAWMEKNGRAITIVLCSVFGAFFLARGLSGAKDRESSSGTSDGCGHQSVLYDYCRHGRFVGVPAPARAKPSVEKKAKVGV